MTRRSHLVGTIPAPDARAAMELALAELGPTLDMLPDGETGGRLNWVQQFIKDLGSHPDIDVVQDGNFADYDDAPRYKVKRGHKLDPDSIDFGYLRYFKESYPVYRELIAKSGHDIPFQVGIPSDFDISLFSMGPRVAFGNRKAFTAATVREISEIQAEAGENVVFQIEVPAELISVARMPGPLKGPMARYMAGFITKIARESPQGSRFGIHLCLGDLGHRSLAKLRDVTPVVLLANAIVKRWPEGRRLDFMHAPFAAAVEPPDTDPRWYEPLKKLRLPESTRFIAGFAHDKQELEVQRGLRDTIEAAIGGPVDIAASCGLGRRTPEDGVAVMRRTGELAAD